MKAFSPVLTAVAATILLASPLASAADMYQEGDIIIRGGIGVVDPNEDSTNVVDPTWELNSNAFGKNGVGVNSDTQLAVSGTYIFNQHFGIELLAATPFKHDLVGNGGLAGVDLGETKHLPPTLTLQYYFPNADLPIHPYIGVGVNYTIFFSEKTDSGLAATLDTVVDQNNGADPAPGITSSDIELEDSFGLVFQAGMDIEINENWSLNGAVWYMDIDTEATVTTNAGVTLTSDVDIDPWVYMAGVAYKF